jgi:hypothetical protein
MSTATIPLTLLSGLLGPGSQAEEDTLDYLPMPKDMRTYRPPVLPEPEELRDRQQLKAWFGGLLDAAARWQPGQAAIRLDMAALAPADRLLIDQVLRRRGQRPDQPGNRSRIGAGKRLRGRVATAWFRCRGAADRRLRGSR